eukprot:6202395-Lingulodinium_polyedra.AAC.1
MQQLLGMLEAGGGKPSEEMAAMVSQRISGVGQSKVSEDAMNIGRKLEHQARNKLQGAPRSLWASFIDAGLPSQLYRYHEPEWQLQR